MQINARDWIFEVSEDPTAVTPVYAQVGGLETFTLSHSEGEEEADTTTFESGGHPESQPMARGASCTIEGKIKRGADNAPDAGQASADALAQLIGEDALGGFRFRHKDDEDWTVWTAWVSKGDTSGGTNDKTSWSATFKRSGQATTATVGA